MRMPLFLVALCWAPVALAQALPSPSRTVYRCSEGDKVRYSDAPCLGAFRVDVEPTRGANKLSGRTLEGADVRREYQREAFAEGLKPITGMNAKQLDQAGRRLSLLPADQRECARLDKAIPVAEAQERAAEQGLGRTATQQRLFALRAEFQKRRCQ